MAKQVLEISKGGLERRGMGEASFLNELITSAETGITPSDTWLEAYNSKWGGSVDPIFKEGAF
jgi:glutamate--cysteine ligase